MLIFHVLPAGLDMDWVQKAWAWVRTQCHELTMSECEKRQPVWYTQGVRKPTGRSEDEDRLEGASDGKMIADLDECDHGEDLHMTAAAGVISHVL